MLHDIHQALDNLLRDPEGGNLAADRVDVCFEAPTRELVDSLLRPTINFFLFDIEENTDLRQSGVETMPYDERRAMHRMPPRRFDLRYMVSALTSEAEDEHALLWGALAVLLKHSPLPPSALPARLLATLLRYAPRPLPRLVADAETALRAENAPSTTLPADLLERPIAQLLEPGRPRPPELVREVQEERTFAHVLAARMLPLITQVGRPSDSPRAHDLWGALEVRPRPAIFYIVTAPVDLNFAGPPLVRVSRAERRLDQGATLSGVVRDAVGVPLPDVRVFAVERGVASTTDEHGRYILRALPPGVYTLRVARPGAQEQLVTIDTAAKSHDIVLS